MTAMSPRPLRAIRIRGARQNNLKSLDLEIPLGQITVITGVSGSGKSSLAFDTLYAEGQRRYIETFSAYTRQFLERMARPDADSIDGIPAAVAIDQSGAVKTSRSTVGTMTGINDYLKVLMARCSRPHCSTCRRDVQPANAQAVLEAIDGLGAGAFPLVIAAPLALGGFESTEIIAQSLRAQGYARFLRGGEARRVEELEKGDVAAEELEVVIDRLASGKYGAARAAESLEQAFRIGRGRLVLVEAGGARRAFHEGIRCEGCGREFPRLTPGLFSFNTPYGACPTCKGFGKTIELDLDRVIPDPRLSIRRGAIKPWATPSRRRKFIQCLRFCEEQGIDVDRPFGELPAAARKKLIDGHGGFSGVRGFFRRLEEKKYKMHVRVLLARYRGYAICADCDGARLRPEAFEFRFEGSTLAEIWELPVSRLRAFFAELAPARRDPAARLLVDEVLSRLSYLDSVGLGYLTLGRQSRTLSGGEVERVNLTTALGACLVETLFVLDEPSIGLHARDNARLIEILRAIRDRGNTVVVVEHDAEILRAADRIIDLGPGAGSEGGALVAEGALEEVARSAASLTGAFLSGRRRIRPPERRRPQAKGRALRIRGAAANNLKGIDVDVPLGLLAAVTGVSGSGKSSLVQDVLYRGCRRLLGHAVEGEVAARSIEGLDGIDDVVLVDQEPLGRTSRGNPATYLKVYNTIRDRFAGTAAARSLGFGPGHFSFNVDGGRCPDCAGAGAIDVEMQFLSDVSLPCESCLGKRFRAEVLEVRYRGLDIAGTLALTVRQAMEHFRDEPDVVDPLAFIDDLGLGYLRLGQSLNTLSGGEAQRLKLAARVLSCRRETLLFLLDEPTTGLHLADVERLLAVFHGLVERGHSVVVIEHHLDVIRSADWVIDLGPEGGDAGGELVAAGTPEEVSRSARSITGEWIRRAAAAADAPPPGRRARPERVRRDDGDDGVIRVVGARENNLKNITVELPRDRLVVVTGMSGSGKSSLLYEIVHAEGQRRYLDCLSPYARQFVEELHRPDIDHLEGIPPTVAIEQRTTIGGRKSTVGTVTEVYQFLRLLYTRCGVQECPDCRVEVAPRSLEEIRSAIEKLARSGGRLLAPVVRGKKGFHHLLFSKARRLGIDEARIDGKWVKLHRDRELRLERHRAHDIDLVAARFEASKDPRQRLRDALDLALDLGGGVLRFVAAAGDETVFNRSRSCPSCGRAFPEPDPRNFSFNSRHGACERCGGYGSILEIDPEQLIADWKQPLDGGRALAVLDGPLFPSTARRRFLRGLEDAGVDIRSAPAALGARGLRALLDGRGGFRGLRGWVAEALDALDEEEREPFFRQHGAESPCPSCRGGRLQDVWAAVRVGGKGIAEAASLPVAGLRRHFEAFAPPEKTAAVAVPIVGEILDRLRFLEGLGLGYLGVDRRVDTLSGGEAQRIRLAAQLGSNLRGVCYILDEPTIGLHGWDSHRLMDSLKELRDRGNSVLVIEHDEAAIAAADHIIDLGPGPGHRGGEVVAAGSLEDVLGSERSMTGKALRERGERALALSAEAPRGPWIAVAAARLHNLRGFEARFPIGALTIVTGPSGAGKSTLVREILERGVQRALRGRRRSRFEHGVLLGAEAITSVREVDQRPIGRSPRSTPATYVGLWDAVRRVFAASPDARVRGFAPQRFSFNVAGGRCERCAGQGAIKLEMNFLPDVRVDCDRCRGTRFEPETLKVAYRGKTIAEVLAMEASDARDLFANYPEIARTLDVLIDLGLGYLSLGQASTTLSGGEAQRLKLALELSKSEAGTVLYLLDEPTIGLHMLDVANLAAILKRLSRRGHAVVVIEHHVELLAAADWVIELGPGGGDDGGELLYQGPPAGLLELPSLTPTGRWLAQASCASPSRIAGA
jgi:excinuclease ABC subunit A